MKKKYLFIGIGIILLVFFGLFVWRNSLQKRRYLQEELFSSRTLLNHPSECNIKSFKKIRPGWFPRWHPTKNLVVFSERAGLMGGIFEIFTMRPDGTEVRCLTCGKDIPGTYKKFGIHGHRGGPVWHPSGKYILFSATNEHGELVKGVPEIALPNHDLYIMTADGEKYWQITDMPPGWSVWGPDFSHDGAKIEWTEEYSCERETCPQPWLSMDECRAKGIPDEDYEKCRCCHPFSPNELIRNQGEEFALLRIKVADISFGPNGPVIDGKTPPIDYRDIKTIHVNHEGKRMLDHGSGFTPNDDRFIFKLADINETNGRPFCADIYTSNLNGDFSSFNRLTYTPNLHNENSAFSPDGKKIAYTEGPLVGYVFFKLDLYLMDANGGNKERLTYFNEPGYPEYDGQLHYVDEGSWSPDGRQYMVMVYDQYSENINISDWSGNFCSGEDMDDYWKRIEWQEKNKPEIYQKIQPSLYMLTFEGPCGKS